MLQISHPRPEILDTNDAADDLADGLEEPAAFDVPGEARPLRVGPAGEESGVEEEFYVVEREVEEIEDVGDGLYVDCLHSPLPMLLPPPEDPQNARQLHAKPKHFPGQRALPVQDLQLLDQPAIRSLPRPRLHPLGPISHHRNHEKQKILEHAHQLLSALVGAEEWMYSLEDAFHLCKFDI